MILPAVTQLLIIQDRDRKLRQLKGELKSAPLEKAAAEAKASGTAAALDAAKLRAKEIEVKRKELENEVRTREERIAKYEQPPRLDHPGDFRVEFIGKYRPKPPKLRKERSIAPLVTLLLLVAFAFVFYYGWRVLWQG